MKKVPQTPQKLLQGAANTCRADLPGNFLKTNFPNPSKTSARRGKYLPRGFAWELFENKFSKPLKNFCKARQILAARICPGTF
ncbi:MAG: hypothetical protein IJX47_00565 [Clostridia bacterium]|nr:hypothetical protein [Clostridia bacterium]